ncbi:fimbrial biogenesis chaperone [Halomonas sp. LS-001]
MQAIRIRYMFWMVSLLGLLLTSFPAAASSLQIWPIYPVIESHQQASALWLENRGDKTANIQLRIFSWSQAEGDDHFQPQQALVGSPPMMVIAPGERQLVRLIRQAATPPGKEQAYRIIIDEVPDLSPVSDDQQNSPQAAISLQMRYSLPLFVYGEGASGPEHLPTSDTPYPELTWKIVQQEAQPQLEIRNTGQHHARLSQVAFEQSGQKTDVSNGLLGYVLPGQTQRWPLPVDIQPGSQLRASVSGQSYRISPE